MKKKKVKGMDEDTKQDSVAMRILKEILETGVYLLVVLAVTLFIITFVGQRVVVNGQSMINTLQDKDNLIVEKLSYRFSDPERFDIIVFPYKHEKRTYYIKRIIGLPGETVRIDEFGNIYINGSILSESYGRERIASPGLAETEIQLSDDEYFVLGDNRNNSRDSRDYLVGNIKRDDIIGKAWVRIYPFDEMMMIQHR